MATKNHNIRFNMDKADDVQAWELLHSERVGQMFKSQNSFVVAAILDYYNRCIAVTDDPYLETREKEDAFAHGFGMQNIRDIARHYQGTLSAGWERTHLLFRTTVAFDKPLMSENEPLM